MIIQIHPNFCEDLIPTQISINISPHFVLHFICTAIGMYSTWLLINRNFRVFCAAREKFSVLWFSIQLFWHAIDRVGLIAEMRSKFSSVNSGKIWLSAGASPSDAPKHSIRTWFLRFLLLKQVGFVVESNLNAQRSEHVPLNGEAFAIPKSILSHRREPNNILLRVYRYFCK